MLYSEETFLNLDTPLAELTYTVFDLETTGTSAVSGDEILEVGAVRVEPGYRIKRKEAFQMLVKPSGNIPLSSTSIHGISEQTVRRSKNICEVLYDFIDYASGSILVAHDAPKDMMFIRSALKEYGMGNPFEVVLDTLQMSKKVYPLAKFHNLDEIMERHQININSRFGRHRALYDAEVTAVAFRSMMRKISQVECFTLIELMEYLRPY